MSTTNKRTVYKVDDDLEALLALDLRTTVRKDDGIHKEWARESSLGKKFAEGYELETDSSAYLGTTRMQDASQRGGGIRIPSGDNNDPLVLVRIPLENYRKLNARSQALATDRENRIKSHSYEKNDGKIKVDTNVRTQIENKN